jgi:hypothetical protein
MYKLSLVADSYLMVYTHESNRNDLSISIKHVLDKHLQNSEYIKGKEKILHYLMKHHSMTTYGGADVQLHSPLDGID